MGGIVAERMLPQLYKNQIIIEGIVHSLGKEKGVIGKFRDFSIEPIESKLNEIIKSNLSIIIAIEPFQAQKAIEKCIELGIKKERIKVINPYTCLRVGVLNIDFANEKRYSKENSLYRDAEKLFFDEMSKEIYRRLVEGKTYNGSHDEYEIVGFDKVEDYYFWSEDYWDTYTFKKSFDATIIDCGAYIGDSIEQLCRNVNSQHILYYAFEPNDENIKQISANYESENGREIVLMNYGIGEENRTMYFELPDTKKDDGGRFTENPVDERASKLEIKCMDDMNLPIKGKVFLKMDIEGAELSALKGAKRFINKNRPCMAVCVYHRKNDLIDIPLFINSIVENYNYYLRGGFHTILWAIPKELDS